MAFLSRLSRIMNRIMPSGSADKTALPFILSQNPFVRIITLKKGKYRVSAGTQPGKINLHRDFRLMPLTIGLLKQFKGNDIVEEILNREENVDKEDMAVVVSVSIFDALELLEIFNQRFNLAEAGIRVRIPTEAVIDVFVSSRGNPAEKKSLARILTSNLWTKSVDTKVIEKYFAREHVGKDDVFVVRSAEHPKLRAELNSLNHSHLNCLLLEVIVRTTDPREPTLA